MTKPFSIRDPVHAYVRVAGHERQIVDHAVTQRLRYVAQTGLVHLVYPEARTSRFSHSLGAMHLASRFFSAAIENASALDRTAVVTALRNVLTEYNAPLRERHLDAIQHAAFGPLLGCGGVAAAGLSSSRLAVALSDEAKHLMAFAEAGLRLAALFHDVGHFPFSHDFEFALQAYLQEEPGDLGVLADSDHPHEELGHNLAGAILHGLALPDAATRAVYWLAKRILDESPPYSRVATPQVSIVGWLHSIVDGDVDADRADYLLRDGRNLGFEFAQYDLDRLADNLVVAQHADLGFVTAVDERGLAALETFLQARARSHQFMVRHHKVTQFGAAFRYLTTEALRGGQGVELLQSLTDILVHPNDDRATNEARLSAFAKFDDVWWLGKLRDFAADGDLQKACAAGILERKPALVSLWKRPADLTTAQIRRMNAAADADFADQEGNVHAEELRRELLERNVLLAIHSFKPYKKRFESAESVVQVRHGEQLSAASSASLVLPSLDAWWSADVHVFAFALATADRTAAKADTLERLLRFAPA